MRSLFVLTPTAVAVGPCTADEPQPAVTQGHATHLGELYVHPHRKPELSFREVATAAPLAAEPRAAGIEIADGAGGPPVPSHHSPLVRFEPERAVALGAREMTVAVREPLGTD